MAVCEALYNSEFSYQIFWYPSLSLRRAKRNDAVDDNNSSQIKERPKLKFGYLLKILSIF